MTDLKIKKNATEKEDGELIYRKTYRLPNGGTRQVEKNVNKMLRAGKRTSDDIEDYVREAEYVANGVTVENPYRPSSEDMARRIVNRLEQEGLEPAWEQIE